METTATKNTATLLQLSAYSQYFFPLGNYIFPTLLWSMKKHESEFVNYNGRQAINFQLSLLVYTLVLLTTGVTIFLCTIFSDIDFSLAYNDDWFVEQFNLGKITGLVILGAVCFFLGLMLKVAEFFLILYAAVKNSNGENFNYPLTINFIK
jgi:uncharacterized Tic20 family protein